MNFEDKGTYRSVLYYLLKALKEKNCTTIVISEKHSPTTLTPFDFEPFLADGVIELSLAPRTGGVTPALAVRKMPGTGYPQAFFPIDIDENGLKLLPGT